MFEERDGFVEDGVLRVRRSSGPPTVDYQNPWQRVLRIPITLDGRTKELFTTDYGARAAVVVVRDSAVLLVRQYRYLVDRISWEIPGGRINPNEAPADGAVRECLEETGVTCRSLRLLLFFHPGMDTLHNPTSLFACEESEGDPVLAHETVDARWVPLTQALAWVWDGTIVDSLSILGLLAYTTQPSE